MPPPQSAILLPIPPAARCLGFVATPGNDLREALLRRMAGLDDGIDDALLRFTRPETGGYDWSPPPRETPCSS